MGCPSTRTTRCPKVNSCYKLFNPKIPQYRKFLLETPRVFFGTGIDLGKGPFSNEISEAQIGCPPFYADDPMSTCRNIIHWRNTLAFPAQPELLPDAVHPESRNLEPGTRNPRSDTRNPKPGTRNPEPETRNRVATSSSGAPPSPSPPSPNSSETR